MGLRTLALIATIVALGGPRPSAAQPCAVNLPRQHGYWATLPIRMPVNPISATLMRNGRVLFISGSENDGYNERGSYRNAIWDPTIATQDAIEVQTLDYDVFCSGVATLADGRPFIVGGTIDYAPPFWGDNRASVFDPTTSTFLQTAGMVDGRWYATTTVLGDGRVVAFSGNLQDGTRSKTVEIFDLDNADAPWSSPAIAPFSPPLYPRMMLLPNGRIFFTGHGSSTRPRSYFFDPGPKTWQQSVATTASRGYGSSVLLPLTPPAYRPKVMNFGGEGAAGTTEIIDLGAVSPAWTPGPAMSAARIQGNAVLLPDGKVLVLGGSSVDRVADEAGKRADLYDPATNTMRSAGTAAYARTYHSVALLLPDATVASLGSNPNGAGGFEPAIEIYTPPYLFDANDEYVTARPAITSVPAGPLGYAAPLSVSFTSPKPIASAVLVRLGSTTHAIDMEQRVVGLCGPSPQPACSGAGTLGLVTPANPNVAPPGYYMLFLVDAAGVPSRARFVQLSHHLGAPPAGTITSPSGDRTITAGQSVSFQAATGPAEFAWVFPGGTPAISPFRTPGQVTFDTPGKHVVSLTAIDASGNTDPSPATRTITVLPPSPDFEIAVDPPWWFIKPGQSVQYTVSVTPRSGFAGTVNLALQVELGLPAGVTSAGFTPPTISGGGSSTLRINTTTAARPWALLLTVRGTSGSLERTASASLLVNLPAPASLTATAGNGQVVLGWPAAPGATGYRVKRARRAGGPYVAVGCKSTPGFTDTGLTNGVRYYYVVASTFASGMNLGGESADSPEASATPGGGPTTTTSTSTSTTTTRPTTTSTTTTRPTTTSTTTTRPTTTTTRPTTTSTTTTRPTTTTTRPTTTSTTTTRPSTTTTIAPAGPPSTTRSTTTTPPTTSSTTSTLAQRPPVCASAALKPVTLKPRDERLIDVAITGVTDPDGDPVTVTVTSLRQDEALKTAPCGDGAGVGGPVAALRATRAAGRGRVYRVAFEATDGRGGRCSRTLTACVAGSGVPSTGCEASGTAVDSTAPGCTGVCAEACAVERILARAYCSSAVLPGRLARSLQSARRTFVTAAAAGSWATQEAAVTNIARAEAATNELRGSGAISASCASTIRQVLAQARAAMPGATLQPASGTTPKRKGRAGKRRR